MYRCATVSEKEQAALKGIEDVVRLGRIKRICADRIELEQGEVPFETSTLFIDCTADGLEKRPTRTVFTPDLITLQCVRACQQVFSAAFIAHCEAAADTDERRNALCQPVSHPNTDLDWLRMTLDSCRGELLWAQDTDVRRWLLDSRLN